MNVYKKKCTDQKTMYFDLLLVLDKRLEDCQNNLG